MKKLTFKLSTHFESKSFDCVHNSNEVLSKVCLSVLREVLLWPLKIDRKLVWDQRAACEAWFAHLESAAPWAYKKCRKSGEVEGLKFLKMFEKCGAIK
jgi:hypothetical protein